VSFVEKHSRQARRVLAALGLTLLAVGCSGNGPPANTMPDPMNNPMSYQVGHAATTCTSGTTASVPLAECVRSR